MDNRPDTSEGSATALTKWKNAPTILDLKNDLLEAKSSHDSQETQIREWLDHLNVTGSAVIKARPGNSQIVPKLIRKQAEWRYSSLTEPFLSTDDLFNVKPVTWEDREAAQQNEIVLAYQFNTQIDKVRFIDDFVRTAVDEGTVITKVGWEFHEEEYEEETPIVEFRMNPEMVPMHEHIANLKENSPSQYETEVPEELKQAHDMSMEQGVPIEPVVIGYEMQTKTRTVYNRPTLEVCDYRNVIIDPTCMGDIDKANFVIYKFPSSLSTLEKDGRYKNLDKINVESNSILAEPDYGAEDKVKNFNFSDKPRKKFVVYEYWGYWDINGTGLLKPIIASWVGDTLIRMEENPFPDKKIPFVVTQYLPVRRKIYGEPDGALLVDNQKIIGAVTRGMIDIMGKSANGQTGIRKDALDVTNRRRYEKGQDYEINGNVDPRQAIYMHTYPEIPQSAQFMLSFQNNEAESLTGVKAYSQGIGSQSLGNVATAIRGALDAASKRELGILRRLAQGVVAIGRKIISMNSEFLSEKEVIRITNEQFVTIRRDDLAGKFDLKLSISTAEEDNNKAEELAFMLQTMGNNMDPTLSKMILGDIARLRKMPDLAHKIESYEPQPDPLAQRKAELEIQLLEAQLQSEMAKAQHLGSGAELNMARAGTESVKAGNIQSDTDLKNLDFVEQEMGVKQERELQLRGEQAKSQAQLKMLDHGLKRQDDAFKDTLDSAKEIRKYLANR